MAGQRHRASDPAGTHPTPVAVLGPAAAGVALLLLVALVASPGSLLVRVTAAPDPVPAAGATASAVPSARAVLPRDEPRSVQEDRAGEVTTALSDLLRARDAAVGSGDPAGWLAASAAPDVASGAAGASFRALTSLPVTRFESTLVPGSVEPVTGTGTPDVPGDGLAGGDAAAPGGRWQARVGTVYELSSGPQVLRHDTVVLEPGADGPSPPGADAPGPGGATGWRVGSWTPYPAEGQVGTSAPWDLGPVAAMTGERAVVLVWDDARRRTGTAAAARDAGAWGAEVVAWADEGAAAVDSYLGTGWPRLSLLLVPATTEQYDALVPGPRPGADDVFAAVATDVDTPDGSGGDVVVLNPAARDLLVDETWQVTVTHELVHVASGAVHGDGQEVWLAEGLADLVGWSTAGEGPVDREVVAARLLERVRSGDADLEHLPDGTDFGSADPDVVGDAYEGAWLAVMLLQDEIGTDALLDVYVRASTGGGTAQQRTDRALREVLGESRSAFEDRWAEHLRALAAP